MRAFPCVDNDQAFRVLDQPASNRKTRAPVCIDYYIQRARRTRIKPGLLVSVFDLYIASLNAMDFHGSVLKQQVLPYG